MFQFELVHVPGMFHGPDGLSRRKRQPDDLPDEEDDFDDWIDQVHGFLHFILPTSTYQIDQPPTTIYIFQTLSNTSTEPSTTSNDTPGEPANPVPEDDDYAIVPRTDLARKANERIRLVQEWHTTLQRPREVTEKEYEQFLRYCTEFFISGDRLWRKDHKGEHKLVVLQKRRLFIIASAHNDTGHRGFFATNALITLRYWWPFMGTDIAWFIKTCHICQTRRTQNVLIPPVVATPAPLCAKIYVDTMHMPLSSGFKYIIQGRCSITHWPEFDMLRKENARAIGE